VRALPGADGRPEAGLSLRRRYTLGLKADGRNWFGQAPGMCGGAGVVRPRAACLSAQPVQPRLVRLRMIEYPGP
jgi:hypothetical protein